MIEYRKLKSPPSVGTRGDSRGATQVNAVEIKIPAGDATGRKSQRHSFQVRRRSAVIPLLYNGSAQIGLLGLAREILPLHVRPLNSEVHSASALLPCFQTAVIADRVLGSLEIALKRTRPRQRF
jgi:hypothetical protein